MDERKQELNKIRSYTTEIDKDLTMILQTLQWDRKYILEHHSMINCRYDLNHKVLSNKLDEHQQRCLLQHNGYTSNHQLLPDPINPNASTLVKLNKEEITTIIENASKSDPMFKKGLGSGDLEPLTLDRLQCAYSSDERRAIHDAVVSAAPACHDLTDLALLSAGDADEAPKTKTRMEILAELRDMRRRRTKYRVAPKTRNYSDVLRDVIRTQMEHYNGAQGDVKSDVEVNANINKEYVNTFCRDDRKDNKGHGAELSKRDDVGEGADSKNRERKESRRLENGNANYRIKDSYREIRNIRQDDGRYRDKSGTFRRDHDKPRDRPRDIREKHKHRERSPQSSHDLDRGLRQNRLKEEYDKDSNRNRKDRSKEKRRYDDRHRNLSDKERARHLITEIKREIEPTVSKVGVASTLDSTYPGSSAEIKQEQAYIETEPANDHNEYNESNNYNGCKLSNVHKSSDIKFRNHRDDYKRDKNKDYNERKYSFVREERDKRRDRYRDKSRDREAKKSRTEDKHRIYNEIYSELNRKLIKET